MALRVFVLGATGDQGRPLVARLRAEGHHVTAALRDRAERRAGLPEGVDAATADLADAAGLARAMRGHDAIAFHLPFVHDRDRARAMGAAVADGARQTGIGRIIFNTSSYVADTDLGLAAHDGRRAIEAELQASGIPFTSIRPTVFMDNLIRPWMKPSIVDKGIFAYPAAPDLRISWVALDVVAAAMTAALTRDDLIGERIALGGPEALVGDEVAERLTAVIGRPIRFKSLDPMTFAGDMAELVTGRREVVPGSVYHGMARFYAWYNAQPRSPLVVDDNVLGIQQTSIATWAAQQSWTHA